MAFSRTRIERMSLDPSSLSTDPLFLIVSSSSRSETKVLIAGDLEKSRNASGWPSRKDGAKVKMLTYRLQTDPSNIIYNQLFAGQTNKKVLSDKDFTAIGVATTLTLFIFAVILYFLIRGKKRLKDEGLVRSGRFTVTGQVSRLFLWYLTNNQFFSSSWKCYLHLVH